MKVLKPSWYNKLAEENCKSVCNYLGIKYKKSNGGNKGVESPSGSSKFKPYIVRVNTDELNIRKEPTMYSDKVGCVKKGDAYTIIKINGNWGFLKSELGWINLKYCIKIK